jgi:hypothetical protein
MKFMVTLRLKPGAKNKALEAFDERGPNRNPGVALRGAWVATHADVVYALVESASEAAVAEAAKTWNNHGESEITAVVDIEQY